MAEDTVTVDEIKRFTDQELIIRVKHLARADQTLNARLVVHLGEVEERGLYRDHAYASMFEYCVEELRMFEHQAYLRIQVARLGRKFPLIVQMLAQGKLTLTTIKQLGPHLTAENHVQLLERASGKGKRDLELVLAAIAPKPDVPSRMRKLPMPSAQTGTRAVVLFTPTLVEPKQAPRANEAMVAPEIVAPQPTPIEVKAPTIASREVCDSKRAAFALETPRPRCSSKPLSPGRYKVEFTAEQALHDKLTQLQELLRHQVPDGDLAVIVERAVDLLLESTMNKRFAQTRAPKKRPSARPQRANSRYIPRAVVREVHKRDGGRCTFVSAEGKRCSARGCLELHHHDRAYARGGKATVENLRLVCRVHNALFAERDYGRSFMRSKRTQPSAPTSELGPDSPGLVPSLIHAARHEGGP